MKSTQKLFTLCAVHTLIDSSKPHTSSHIDGTNISDANCCVIDNEGFVYILEKDFAEQLANKLYWDGNAPIICDDYLENFSLLAFKQLLIKSTKKFHMSDDIAKDYFFFTPEFMTSLTIGEKGESFYTETFEKIMDAAEMAFH